MTVLIRHKVTYTETADPQPLTQGDGDSLSNDIVLDTGVNNLVLSITAQQYQELLSAALNGAVRSFPERYIEVIYPLIKAGKLDFCEQVDDCVETNTTTQNIINNMLIQTGQVNPDVTNPLEPEMDMRFPPSERNEDAYNPPPSCDKDVLWGAILEIVTRLDEMTRDFYEDVVASNDKAERAQAMIDIVPLFGDIAADVINLFTSVAPDVLNGYNSHSSTAVLEDHACTLFELVCNECRYPTYQEIYDSYASFGISGIQDIANYGVQAAVDALIGTNGLANAVVWYTSNAIALYVMYMGGEWLGRRGTKWLQIWADIGEDVPSNGWELLCDGCEDNWTMEWSGAVLGSNWQVEAGSETYGLFSNNVWNATNEGGLSRQLRLELPFTGDVNMTYLEVSYTAYNTRASGSDQIYGGSPSQQVANTMFQKDFEVDTAYDETIGGGDMVFQVRSTRLYVWIIIADNGASDPNAYGTLVSVRAYGNGAIPPEWNGNLI